MIFNFSFSFLLILITPLLSLLHSQQPYEGLGITKCSTPHNSTSLLGYFCNGYTTSCQSFLLFNSQTPYQSISSISSLLNSDPSRLSHLNQVPINFIFPTNTKVIVPVTCSCSGAYYQANSSYDVNVGDTYFTIANYTYHGLSTCQALQSQNNMSASSGFLGTSMKMKVPLRCACPTTSQRSKGIEYLLSYLVASGDTVYQIGQNLGANFLDILDANGLTLTEANIYPFTTLLVPLKFQPNSSLVTKLSPPPSPPPPPPSTRKKSHTVVYVGIGIAVFVCLVILSVIIYYVHLKTKKIALEDDSEIMSKLTSKFPLGLMSKFGLSQRFLSRISSIGQSLKVYKFEELQLATENFSYECKIEGSVYRGVINGDSAAIKMMNRDVSQEIEILKKISHFNVIRLSGLCFSHGHWYLVYEYAQNGSLSNWIFDKSGAMVLSWRQRVQIALDVANGLNYLHSYTEPPYVHKDIKSSNILLDENFRGKIANFGVARPAEGKEGEFELTRHIVGTQGYMAPEYLQHGLISPKLDVYAFGVVLLEIITGRDALSLQKGENDFSIEDFITVVSEEEDREDDQEVAGMKTGSFIDPLMAGDYPFHSVFFIARLIKGCIEKDAASRPNMGEIVQSLSKLFSSSISMA